MKFLVSAFTASAKEAENKQDFARIAENLRNKHDFGYCKVFTDKYAVRITNRQGQTLVDQRFATYNQVAWFILQEFEGLR